MGNSQTGVAQFNMYFFLNPFKMFEPQEVKQTPGSTQMTISEFGKCPWINVRGKSKGTVCNKTTVDENRYCYTHMRCDPTLQKPIEPEETESIPEEQDLVSRFRDMLSSSSSSSQSVSLPIPPQETPSSTNNFVVPITSPLKCVIVTANEVKFVFN
jgi:hypothetical protein